MELDLLQEQLDLEKGMLQYGTERYKSSTNTAKKQGRGSETSYARRLLSVLVGDMGDALAYWLNNNGPGPGKRSSTKKVLRKLHPDCAAYITLKTIFDSLSCEDAVLPIAIRIGQRIEDQIRFSIFEENTGNLYHHIQKEFKERNVVNYRRKHRVLTHAHNSVAEWSSLSTNQKVQIGTVLIEKAIVSTALFEDKLVRVGKETKRVLTTTAETLDWIEEHMMQFALLYPDFAPTVIKPKPWVSLTEGGYYLEPLQRRFPFIKCKNKFQRKGIQEHDYSVAMQAVNKIQDTPWRINQFTFQAMQEVWRLNLRIGMPQSIPIEMPEYPLDSKLKKEEMQPHELMKFNKWKREMADLYTLEKQRVSKCLLLGRILSSATKYTKYESFYFVYNCDFRGRIYAASSGFSPQGPDISKGILEFAEGKALGESGFRWLCIHGANVFGYDKASNEDRVKWCKERTGTIQLIAQNPFAAAARKVWANADKPYQFLAFCKEYSEAIKDPLGFISHLPIALDGSCNGLQHFSAMLRDEVGGKAVNLIPGEVPEDIYSDVAKVCIKKLQKIRGDATADPDGHAEKSLAFGINRKICKKPVMTLPYGSTLRNCLNKTAVYILENPETSHWKDDIYEGATFLGQHIWSSIDDVVIAARLAMKWLKQITGILNKLDRPVHYVTPSGFLMYLCEMQTEKKFVVTQLFGTCKLVIRPVVDNLNYTKQLSGIAPDFVHSLDAAHLTLTVNASNLSSYAMIHDSFGTHACDTDLLAKVLREEFIKLYTSHDVLNDMKEAIEAKYCITLPSVPDKGTLDLAVIKDSEYFFS